MNHSLQIDPNSLINILHQANLSRQEQTLLLLAAHTNHTASISELREAASLVGLREAANWNISSILSRSRGLAVNTANGWVLTQEGRKSLESRGFLTPISANVKQIITDLRSYLVKINSSDARDFVEEAIGCLESGYYRAAVVLSWAGAIAVLQDHVLNYCLPAFNTEGATRAQSRNTKWKPVVIGDDFADVKEFDFLQYLESIKVLSKSVKQELQDSCLKFRNSCGHPSSIKVSKNRAVAHVEVLIDNIFSKF